MVIKKADFLSSYVKEADCPVDGMPAFAFIGRSNVGKSSLINMLVERRALAKVSGTPGKTQLINFFLINEAWYLVDLPGYGYARLSKKMRAKLAGMIDGFLSRYQYLAVAFVLIDANVEPKQVDLDFINQLGEMQVPFAIVFTKTDRMKPQVLEDNTKAFLDEVSKTWETLPPVFITSAEYRTGRDELLAYIQSLLKIFKQSS